jgi:hypothetical protein
MRGSDEPMARLKVRYASKAATTFPSSPADWLLLQQPARALFCEIWKTGLQSNCRGSYSFGQFCWYCYPDFRNAFFAGDGSTMGALCIVDCLRI